MPALVASGLRLQQFHAGQQATVLVLPASARGEQLLKYERALAYGVLVPAEAEEVVERP